MDWIDIHEESAAVWQKLRLAAEERMHGADPEVFRAKVTAYIELLDAWKSDLDIWEKLLSGPGATPADRDKHKQADAHYHDLAAGLFADAENVAEDEDEFGIASSIVIVVGTVGLTMVGVAWAVVTYQYAVEGREQTALELAELQARVALSNQGKSLQPSTLPPRPPADERDDKDGSGVVGMVVGGVIAAAGIGGLAYAWSRSR